MVKCRYCGTANPAGTAFCSHCGGAFAAVPAGKAPAAARAAAGASAGPAVRAAAPQVASATATPPRTHIATGSLPPQTLLNRRYLVLATVGQGGMAAVYRALDSRNSRQVAIKEMSQDGLTPDEEVEALAAFRSEADLLQRLRHPNLPSVLECFSDGARHYLVIEFVEGQTLEQRQQAAGGGPLPETEVVGWARQLCSVLTYLHTRRPPIIFRDLKPANVMVTPQGQIKLIDFGIARVFHPGRTRDTQVLGTPGFAPPEQYGKSQTDARADVYALGVTLYQLLTGYDPATTPFTLPPAHTRNPRIAPHIQAAIERATKLDRDARYPTIATFEKDLLHPDGFVFRNGQRAHTVTDLVALCRMYPQEAQDHLYAHRFESWLTSIGQPHAARAASVIVSVGSDRGAGLAAFIAQATRPQGPTGAPRATAGAGAGAASAGGRPGASGIGGIGGIGGTGASPAASAAAARVASQVAGHVASRMAGYTARRLLAQAAAAAATAIGTQILVEVHPRSVNFGALMHGQNGRMAITVSGQSGLPVTGRVAALANWLRVDRPVFAGPSTSLQLTVDTARLPRPGTYQTQLQISSGTQQLYVPVTVEVLSTRSPSPPPPRAGGGNKAVSSKYGPPPAVPEWIRVLTSWFAAVGLAGSAAHWTAVALAARALTLPFGLPVMLPLFLAMVVMAAPGAVLGRWGPDVLRRLYTAVLGAGVGAGAAWMIAQTIPPQWHVGPSLLAGGGAPLVAMLLGLLGASGGAMVGAHPSLSRRVHKALAFVARHRSVAFAVAAVALGGWLGFALLHPFFYGLLAPCGMIAGMLAALLLVVRANRRVQRAGGHP